MEVDVIKRPDPRQEPVHRGHHGMKPHLESHHHFGPRRAAQFDHFPALVDVVGHRFFAEDVFAGRQGGADLLQMFVRRRADAHHVDAGIGDQRFPTLKGPGARIGGGQFRRARGGTVVDRRHPALRMGVEPSGIDFAHFPGAKNTDVQLRHGVCLADASSAAVKAASSRL
jgi:hypothetical protein